jgi:DNA-binding LacI/PurR family transcriptional regulator
LSAPVNKRVTIREVAAAAGVSTATVSRVLTGEPGIGAATTASVLETARRLQYRPSAAARRLRTRSSSLLGVVVQSLGDGYVGEVVLGIQSRARDHGFRPLFFVSEGQTRLEAEAVDVFLSEQVQEFICVSPTQKPHILRKAVDNGFHVSVVNWDPNVSAGLFDDIERGSAKNTARFGSHSVEKSIWEVKFDDLGAGMLATNHLLALGHRKLAHVRGPNVRSSLLRLLGFRRALEAASLWPQPVVVAEDPVLEARELAIADFLRRQHPPLGIVAYDDLSAVAALRAANLEGWRVPEDLSVVGIDDIPFAAYTNPGLTSVAQPKPELGALAVDLVLAGSDEPPLPRVLDGHLVVRQSTASVSRKPDGGAIRRPSRKAVPATTGAADRTRSRRGNGVT